MWIKPIFRRSPLSVSIGCGSMPRMSTRLKVRVGIMVTHNPLYGSGQAGLPHPALTSGDNAQTAQGIRMTSAGGRQPSVDHAPQPVPEHSGFLTAAQERAMPEPTYLEPRSEERTSELQS